MKKETLILAGAVAFAAFLVAQKTGIIKRAGLASTPYPSFTFNRDTAFRESPEEKGYNPNDPGAFVPLDDLIQGVADNDWTYTGFDQTVDDALAKPGFYLPGFYK